MTTVSMVLVGTVLELSAFVSEAPTGVIADTYRRRLSLIIGCMMPAFFPRFALGLLSQFVCGIGSTFFRRKPSLDLTSE